MQVASTFQVKWELFELIMVILFIEIYIDIF